MGWTHTDENIAPIRHLTTCYAVAHLKAPNNTFGGYALASSSARTHDREGSSRRNRRRCSHVHTPAFCQPHSRRQHVMPLAQPISERNISHGRPLFNTNRMPARAARSLIRRGRPPLGLGGSG